MLYACNTLFFYGSPIRRIARRRLLRHLETAFSEFWVFFFCRVRYALPRKERICLNILYCSDAGLCKGIYLSALSVCRHTHEEVHFFILTASLPDRRAIDRHFAAELEQKLRSENPRVTVTLSDVTAQFTDALPHANMQTRFTPLCMLRLYADLVDDIPDRILYLDADVLCRADLYPLYTWELDGAQIAGVPDRYGKWFFGNPLRHDYLNSGVLLMDMRRIRESGLFEKAREMCRERKMFMPDQTALNRLAVKRKLPVCYNEQGNIRSDTVLKHFTTFFRFFPRFCTVTVKPWQTEQLHEILKIHEFDALIEQIERNPIL